MWEIIKMENKKGRPAIIENPTTRSITFYGVQWKKISAIARSWSKLEGRKVSPSEVCRKIWSDYVNETLYNKIKKEGCK
jgi:hypothetical protein